jgi:hypothetical protein
MTPGAAQANHPDDEDRTVAMRQTAPVPAALNRPTQAGRISPTLILVVAGLILLLIILLVVLFLTR